MKYQLIVVLCWVGLFALVFVGLPVAGAPAWSPIAAWAVICGAQQLYCRVLVPRGTRARLLKAVDPAAGPPAGAAQASSPVPGRLSALATAQDWGALRALLSDDFAVVLGERRFGRNVYVRLLKAAKRDEVRTDEILVHPDEPDVLWVRSTSSGKPRFGPAFVSTTWTTLKLTPDGSRVREIAHAGVLSAA